MGFWDLSTGEALEKVEEFDSNTFTVIPDGTKCNAVIEKASWAVMSEKSKDAGEHYIEIAWRVLAPAEYKNSVLFQKVRVRRIDDKQRDKAIRMLAAIDTIVDGGLSELEDAPTDRQLDKALRDKKLTITASVWEMNGNTGNHVTGVEKIKKAATQSAKPKIEEDDIPF